MKITFTVTLLTPDNEYDPALCREVIQEKLAEFCGPLCKVDVALEETK